MRLLFQKSGWGLTGMISAVVAGLWFGLLFSSLQKKEEAAVNQSQKARIGLVLPSVITPLMPQEVRHNPAESLQAGSLPLTFPSLYKALIKY